MICEICKFDHRQQPPTKQCYQEQIEQLKAELDEYHDAEKFVNDPPHDQICCGCVAILRKQKTQLQAENERLRKNGRTVLYRVQYSLEKLGKEATLLLIEQALKGDKK